MTFTFWLGSRLDNCCYSSTRFTAMPSDAAFAWLRFGAPLSELGQMKARVDASTQLFLFNVDKLLLIGPPT